MGTNKRYAEAIDRRAAMRRNPYTLHDEQIRLDRDALTRPPVAVPVKAWVLYPDGWLEIQGVATAWTERAIAIKWQTVEGEEHRAWVWSNAVERP